VRLAPGKQENGDCNSRQDAQIISNLRSVHGCDTNQNWRGSTARGANPTDSSPLWIFPRTGLIRPNAWTPEKIR
jgi:hypothetical protein